MDLSLVFMKTPKGKEEIETRTHRLAFYHRALLIMVNGQYTGETLCAKSRHLGDSVRLLDELAAQGFIAPTSAASPAPTSQPQALPTPTVPAVSDAAAPPKRQAQGSKTLDELKQVTVDYLFNTLGPDGDKLAMRLEEATSREAFYEEAARVREIIRAVRSPKHAEEFWRVTEERSQPRG